MAEQDVITMRNAYEAFNRADIPAVLEALDPQIEWHEPGGYLTARQVRPDVRPGIARSTGRPGVTADPPADPRCLAGRHRGRALCLKPQNCRPSRRRATPRSSPRRPARASAGGGGSCGCWSRTRRRPRRP